MQKQYPNEQPEQYLSPAERLRRDYVSWRLSIEVPERFDALIEYAAQYEPEKVNDLNESYNAGLLSSLAYMDAVEEIVYKHNR